MGTIVAREVLDRAGTLLYDQTHVHWQEEELTDWLNDAQRAVVRFKPDAKVTNASVALVAGTKQTIPAAGIRLVRVTRNMGANGSTPGRAITEANMDVLDRERPNWHTDTAAATIKHFFYDRRDPRNFYIWPPSDATTQIEIVYSANPTDVSDLDADTIDLDDIYLDAILDWMLYRALSKLSAENKDNAGRQQIALSTFMKTLGVQEQSELGTEPDGMSDGRSRRGR